MRDFLISILSGAITGLFTVYLFYKGMRGTLVQERFNTVIYPIFAVLEPYLFHQIDETALRKVAEIVNKNRKLSGGKLIYMMELCCPKNCSKDNYNELCRYISTIYDRCCLQLGIPLRPFEYRLNHKQFKSKFAYVVFIAFHVLLLLVSFVIFLIAVAFISTILQGLLPALPRPK